MFDCLSRNWQILEDHPNLPDLIGGFKNTTWSNNRTCPVQQDLAQTLESVSVRN